MPMTINGFGTTIVGSRGNVGQNSYDAVEWFVAHGYAPPPPALSRPEMAEQRRGRTSVGQAPTRRKA